jgi:CRISPR-associated protein Cas1
MLSIHSYKYSMEETTRYSTMADDAMASGNVLVLNGHGCGLRVSNKALHVKQGSLLGADREPIIYYKGLVPIKTIVILARSGSISLEALHWCKEQSISIVMLEGKGNLLYSFAPETESNAKLRRLQYQAGDTGMSGYVARELVRKKIVSQMSVMKNISEIKYKRVMKRYWANVDWDKPPQEYLGNLLVELDNVEDIRAILMIEANAAQEYWSVFKGLPIKWQAKDAKSIPPHWKVITERMGSYSGGPGAKSAKNPFNAALNYLYGVAEHLLLCSIHAAGLDPSCGFLHSDKEHRNSLVYDLIEPHRAEIDAQALSFFDRTVLRAGDVTLLPQGQITLNKEFGRYMILSCIPDAKRYGDTVSWLVSVLTGK